MMGTGKTCLGRELARRADVPFVDLDLWIEHEAGLRVPEIVAGRGQNAFRALEQSALAAQLADATPRVVALGAATLLHRPARLSVLARGFLVVLTASIAELARRIAADGSARPRTGEPIDELANEREALERQLTELWVDRAAGYAEAHAVVDTTARPASELVSEVLAVAELDPIPVALGERTYGVDVVLEQAELHLGRPLARLEPSRVVLVTDETVWSLYEGRLDPIAEQHGRHPVRVVLPPGELHKTLASVEQILLAAVQAPVDRHAVVVGVGGGVVTDIAGLAAALALRGLRWVAVPTTVLSMVDASVGGKTGVDVGEAKNAVGAFHQPSRVIVDPSFTRTESARALSSGLAEVIKTAVIGDPALYHELLAPGGAERLVDDRDLAALGRAIRSSVAVKAGVVSRDEREAGERAHLNLGHTIGHALEAQGGYERLSHGEAVALGLVAALRIGVALGVTGTELAAEVVSLLRRLRLPTDLDQQPLSEALRWVAFDKKRQRQALRMVLVRAPGQVEVARVAPADLPGLLRPMG